MLVSRRLRVLLLLALAAYLAWGALYIHRTSFVVEDERVFALWDDAMISMQYARNLREGHGLVWNPGGERVQGISNLGVALGMALLHALPLPDAKLSLAFQAVTLAVLAALLWLNTALALRLAAGREPVAAAAVLATACCAPLAVWTLQGSDVGFVALWLMAAAAWLADPRAVRDRWPPWVFATLGLGLLVRPDMGLFYVLFLASVWRLPGAPLRRLGVCGAILVLVLGGWVLLGALYYGDPLPNTWYLKGTGSPRGLVLEFGLAQLLAWLPRLAPALALAALGLWVGRERPAVGFAAACPAAALAYDVWVGGDWSFPYGSRYVVPTLPLLLMLAALGARRILDLGLPAAWRTRPWVAGLHAVALMAVAVTLSPRAPRVEWFDPSAPTMQREENHANYRFARYLGAHTRPHTSLGLHWGGSPAYFSRRPAIDVLGKSDRHIARMRVPRFFPGHSKWDWDYILKERKPDILRAPSRGLGKRQDFLRDYLKVDTGEQIGFYIHRDSLDHLVGVRVAVTDLRTRQRYVLEALDFGEPGAPIRLRPVPSPPAGQPAP